GGRAWRAPRRSGLAERLVGGGLGFLQFQLPFVERTAGNGADHALRYELDANGLHILDAVQATRGDDRRLGGLRKTQSRLDVDAAHHAVAANVGVDERLDAVVLVFLGEVDHIVAGELGPAFDRDLAVLRVETGDHVSGKGVASVR